MFRHPACRPYSAPEKLIAGAQRPHERSSLRPNDTYGAARRRVAVSYRTFFKRPAAGHTSGAVAGRRDDCRGARPCSP